MLECYAEWILLFVCIRSSSLMDSSCFPCRACIASGKTAAEPKEIDDENRYTISSWLCSFVFVFTITCLYDRETVAQNHIRVKQERVSNLLEKIQSERMRLEEYVPLTDPVNLNIVRMRADRRIN